MSVRLKKLQVAHESLLNGPEEDEFEVQIESGQLISEGEESSYEIQEQNGLLPDISGEGLGWWRRLKWNKNKQYQLNSITSRPGHRIITVHGFRCHHCRINSLRALLVALFVFSAAIVISIVISLILDEPQVVTGKMTC